MTWPLGSFSITGSNGSLSHKSNGSTGCTVGTLSGADFGQYGFGARFDNMADYGKAADKLNGDKVWDNHQEMLSSTIWDGFNLRRVLAENGWKE